MAAKTKRPAGLWMMLYGLAFLLVVSAVSRSADSGSDGDSGFYFYWAGTTPWSELVSDMVARPAKPEYIFGRFRPYSRLSFKALYEAGLSPHAVAVENWIVVWLACLAFAWGVVRILSLGLPKLRKEAVWLIATAIWLAPPLVICTQIPITFVGTTRNLLYFGLSLVLLSDLKKGRERWLRLGGAFLFTLLQLHNHETSWHLLLMLSLWLFALSRLSLSKPGTPRFWWPVAFLAAYLVYFRSFTPPPGDLMGSVNANIASIYTPPLADRLVAHIPYYLMTAFGGLVEPLSSSSLLSRAREQLDITPFPNILPFLMTLAAIALSVQALLRERPKKGGGAEASRRWKAWAWLGAGLLGGALFSTVQFWPMIGYRLIYFSVLPIAFVAIWVMVSSCMGEKIRPLPVILLLVANACTGYYAGSHYSFADVNIDYTRGFVQSVLQRPDVKDCTSERPCCLDIGWWNIARSAESINYDLGISHQPPFHGVNAKMHLGSEAASWPQCVKTIKID